MENITLNLLNRNVPDDGQEPFKRQEIYRSGSCIHH